MRLHQLVLPPSLRLSVHEVETAKRTQVNASASPYRALDIDVQNERNSDVLAYVLRVEFYSPGGKLSSASASRIINTGEPVGGSRTMFSAGKTWRHPNRIYIAKSRDGIDRKYAVTVDYVSFADGFRSGLDESGLAKDTEGFLRGIATAKMLQSGTRPASQAPIQAH